MKKIITVFGGSGYVGQRAIQLILKKDSNVQINVVSRGVQKVNNHLTNNNRIKILPFDALHPGPIEQQLIESTGVIHSIGQLLTLQPNNDDSSYYSKNYLTAIRPAKLINEANKAEKTNFVYVSAERGFPFPMNFQFGGYIQYKRQTEEELKQMKNLRAVIVRPGFITDNSKVWTGALAPVVNIYHGLDNLVKKTWPELSDFMSLPAKAIPLDYLAEYLAAGALGELEERIYGNDEMINNRL